MMLGVAGAVCISRYTIQATKVCLWVQIRFKRPQINLDKSVNIRLATLANTDNYGDNSPCAYVYLSPEVIQGAIFVGEAEYVGCPWQCPLLLPASAHQWGCGANLCGRWREGRGSRGGRASGEGRAHG